MYYYQVPLSPKEFQVQSDGVLHDERVYLQVHDFVDVDVMKTFDAAPATQASVTATVELEEDVHGGDNNDNDHDNEQEQAIQTMRSGRVVQARARFDDIDWQEYNAAARQNISDKQLLQQVIQYNSDDNSSYDDEFHDSVEKEQQPAVEHSQQVEEDDNSEAIENVEDKDDELAAVGASLGGGLFHTAELKPLNYEQTMGDNDKGKWLESMDEEKAL